MKTIITNNCMLHLMCRKARVIKSTIQSLDCIRIVHLVTLLFLRTGYETYFSNIHMDIYNILCLAFLYFISLRCCWPLLLLFIMYILRTKMHGQMALCIWCYSWIQLVRIYDSFMSFWRTSKFVVHVGFVRQPHGNMPIFM